MGKSLGENKAVQASKFLAIDCYAIASKKIGQSVVF